MDVILILIMTGTLLAVAVYGVNSLRHIRGIKIFPLLRIGEKGEIAQTSTGSFPIDDLGAHPRQRVGIFETGGEDMITVGQIVKRQPLKIQRNESVEQAARLMAQQRIGSLLVHDEEGEVQGIVTETDIVRKVTAAAIPPVELKVAQVMSAPVISIDCMRPVTEADELMDQYHLRHLAVTENGRIVGMISVRDLLHPIFEEQPA